MRHKENKENVFYVMLIERYLFRNEMSMTVTEKDKQEILSE